MSYYDPEVVALHPCPRADLEVVWSAGTEDECAVDVICLAICNLINAQGDKSEDCRGVVLPVIFNDSEDGAAPFEAITPRYYELDGPIVRRKKEEPHV